MTAREFRNVDAANDPNKLIKEMQLVGSQDFTKRYCKISVQALGVSEGDSILDLGCGTAHDLDYLVEAVGLRGKVTLLDSSQKMLTDAEKSKAKLSKESRSVVEAVKSDMHRLPFLNNMYSAVRVVRTLQHVQDPLACAKEAYRVLQPGGKLVVAEPDWGTLTINSGEQHIAQMITDIQRNRIRHAWIGRQLSEIFNRAGFDNLSVETATRTITSLETAETNYSLKEKLAELVRENKLTQESADNWYTNLQERDKAGNFFCSLTLFLVSGVKTAQKDPE